MSKFRYVYTAKVGKEEFSLIILLRELDIYKSRYKAEELLDDYCELSTADLKLNLREVEEL